MSAIFSLAKGDPEPPRLIGFVNNDVAVLEANEVVPTASITRRRQVILKEGQSDFGLQLIKILPEEGAVKVLVSGGAITTISLKNHEASASFSPKRIALENANLETVLKLYGELSKRTVLKYPELPNVNLGLKSSTTNQSETIRLIEKALAEQRIRVVLDGEKFVLLANKDQASSLEPKSSAIPQFSTNVSRTDVLPKGAIHFEGASVEQALRIYAEIYGKSWIEAHLYHAARPIIFT